VSKSEKLLDRFLSIPADFTWDEFVSLMGHFGFRELANKGGSYRCFVSAQNLKIFLHKPHPSNVMRRYALRQVRAKLKEFGLLG
jgi:hypothetical protein